MNNIAVIIEFILYTGVIAYGLFVHKRIDRRIDANPEDRERQEVFRIGHIKCVQIILSAAILYVLGLVFVLYDTFSYIQLDFGDAQTLTWTIIETINALALSYALWNMHRSLKIGSLKIEHNQSKYRIFCDLPEDAKRDPDIRKAFDDAGTLKVRGD